MARWSPQRKAVVEIENRARGPAVRALHERNIQMKIMIATLTMVGLVGVATAQPATTPAKPATPATPATPAKPATPPAKAATTITTTTTPAAKVDAKVDAKAAKPVMPKPPTELGDMGKAVVGTWRCTGTETGQDGASGKMTATVRAKLDLDKWWISESMDAKGTRGSYKSVAYTTYDPGSKKWRRVSVDSMGNQFVGTSDGMKENKLTWNMDMMGGMGAGMFRDYTDMTAAKAGVKMWGEMSMDKGKTWNKVYELTCKK
ncbi:MAG: hypothetical protein H0X17_09985 [Deltaproteobacteria bacterium]|nr:hypothetical protein [Deltaproteobacteria bacterium]